MKFKRYSFTDKKGIAMRNILLRSIVVFAVALFLFPAGINAQITAPGSAFADFTVYPVSSDKDQLFIFCSSGDMQDAVLTAKTTMTGTKTWEWEKFNRSALAFEFYRRESTSFLESSVSGLDDGLYRVTITKGDTIRVYRAWVISNRKNVKAEITESNCDFFALKGSMDESPLEYFDPVSGQPVELAENQEVEWHKGDELVSRILSPKIFDPPTKDTEYVFTVKDRFGCTFSDRVTYRSIVTKAAFKADPMSGEAPLEVKFSNTSENGDPGLYEWFFFRNLDDIKKESARTTLPVDSFMFVKPVTNDNPEMVYENSGTYMVKLVSKKQSELHLCTDTVYMEDFIVVDTSYFAVPNVFTPNGDGTNDLFVVKFWSMQSVKISVFNRWGRVVHVWQSGNVRGFEKTWTESVWDGRIGGRIASPGVYFYVVEGTGRDGKKRWKHGNVYLIRGK